MASHCANHLILIIIIDYILRRKTELEDENSGDYFTDVVVIDEAVNCSSMIYFILPTCKFNYIHRVLFLKYLEHFKLLLSLL